MNLNEFKIKIMENKIEQLVTKLSDIGSIKITNFLKKLPKIIELIVEMIDILRDIISEIKNQK